MTGNLVGWRMGVLAAVGFAALLLLLVAGGAHADSATLRSLPVEIHKTSALWDGWEVLAFGGIEDRDGRSEIVRFDPEQNAVTVAGAAMPTARGGTAAVWNGTYAFIFGGYDEFEVNRTFYDEILRYDPVSDTLEVMTATLPTGRGDMGAVWDGRYAYLIGGFDENGYSDQILRYEPASDTLTTLTSRLPEAEPNAAPVWDGQVVWVLGFDLSSAIIRFDPASGDVTRLSETLPMAGASSAVWDGSQAFVFGGRYNGDEQTDRIASFDPASGTATLLTATLPVPAFFTSAAWDGRYAYVVGGYPPPEAGACCLSTVVRFDPVAGVAANATTQLPDERAATLEAAFDGTNAYIFDRGIVLRYQPRSGDFTELDGQLPIESYPGPAVFDGGQYVYVFGGDVCPTVSCISTDVIQRYDTAADAADLMMAHLPAPRGAASAVWTGTDAYVFGGTNCTEVGCASTAEIVRYDPEEDTATVVASLPSPRFSTSAVWTGAYAYIFGGRIIGESYDDIVRFDPATNEVEVVGHLPDTRYDASAVWDGTYAYHFGGVQHVIGDPYVDEVLRFDPATGAVELQPSRLPSDREGTAAVWTEGIAHVIGGYNGEDIGDQVVRYDPRAAPPRNLSATRGPGAGEATLRWLPSLHEHGATTYRIHRGTSPGNETYLASVGDVLEFVDEGSSDGADRFYKVSAVDEGGEGLRSNEARMRADGPPTEPLSLLASRGPGAGQISLTWEAPADDGGYAITAYRVYRGTAPEEEALLAQAGDALQFTDADLPPGALRYYKVSAVNQLGESPLSGESSARTFDVPGAPASLTASPGPGVGELTLDWQPPGNDGGLGIQHYNVYRATSSGGTYSLIATLGDVLTYTDTGLPNGATRWYKVSATTDAGEGPESSTASGTTYDVPGAPTGIAVTAGPGAGELKITWSAPSSDGGLAITNYKLYRATSSGGTYSLVATLGNALTYTDTGLPNSATRWYKVSAKNDAGEGTQSTSTSGTTFDVPGAPASLTATAGPGVGEIKLTWQAPSTNGGTAITGYKVYRSTSSGGTYSLIASLGSVLTYTDTALGNGATRFYKVSAANLVGESAQSTSASATTFDLPSEPRNLAATSGPGAGEISLSWQAPSSNGGTAITGYKIYRATTSGGPYSAIASLGSVLSYKDTGLPSSATRYYKVSAANLVGEGPQSTEATATSPAIVPPSAPLNLAAAPGPGAGQIKLTWNAPAQDGGAPVTGYAVYRADASTGPYTKITTLGNVLTHTDTGLPNGATRWYKLAAINEAGEGPQSASASARTFDKPTAPRNLDGEANLAFHVTLGGLGLGIHLTWDAPSDDGGTAITIYKVYWTTDPNQPGQLVATIGNVHDWTHTDADPLQPNYYRITAVNLVGESPASPRACALTYPWAAAPLLAPPGGGCPA